MQEVNFKMTDCGLIPVEWEDPQPINELFGTYPTATLTRDQLADEGRILCIHYGDIHKKFGAVVDVASTNLPATNDLKYFKYVNLANGDLILADTSEDYDGVGKGISIVGVGDKKVISGLHTLPLRDKCDKFDARFLGYYFQSSLIKPQLEAMAVGTKVYSISYNSISECVVPIPLRDEQERIAKALSDIDSLIISLDELIEKKQNMFQGAMQRLLSGETRLAGYDKPWEEKSMSQIGKLYNGITGKTGKDFGQGNAKYVTFLNVLSNPRIDCTQLELVNISPTENQNQVRLNDLCFNVSSETPEEVGICASMQDDISEVYLNSFCFGFRIDDDEVDSLFLAFYFRTEQAREAMAAISQGSTRYNLSKEYFDDYIVIIPHTKKEQQDIARVLTDMSDEINELQAERDKYQMVRDGMMQELLTGRIRLI